MAEMTKIELVTPARIMLTLSAEMVVMPGIEGLFGVLPRHAPMLAGLQRGVVEIYEAGQITNRIMIDGGLADVTGESVTILAERAEDLSQVSKQDLTMRANTAPETEADFLRAVEGALS